MLGEERSQGGGAPDQGNTNEFRWRKAPGRRVEKQAAAMVARADRGGRGGSNCPSPRPYLYMGRCADRIFWFKFEPDIPSATGFSGSNLNRIIRSPASPKLPSFQEICVLEETLGL